MTKKENNFKLNKSQKKAYGKCQSKIGEALTSLASELNESNTLNSDILAIVGTILASYVSDLYLNIGSVPISPDRFLKDFNKRVKRCIELDIENNKSLFKK